MNNSQAAHTDAPVAKEHTSTRMQTDVFNVIVLFYYAVQTCCAQSYQSAAGFPHNLLPLNCLFILGLRTQKRLFLYRSDVKYLTATLHCIG